MMHENHANFARSGQQNAGNIRHLVKIAGPPNQHGAHFLGSRVDVGAHFPVPAKFPGDPNSRGFVFLLAGGLKQV